MLNMSLSTSVGTITALLFTITNMHTVSLVLFSVECTSIPEPLLSSVQSFITEYIMVAFFKKNFYPRFSYWIRIMSKLEINSCQFSYGCLKNFLSFKMKVFMMNKFYFTKATGWNHTPRLGGAHSLPGEPYVNETMKRCCRNINSGS